MYSTTADGDDFVEIASGTRENNKTLKVVDFDLVNARRIRIVVTSTLGDSANTFISAAETNLYCTDYSALQEKLPKLRSFMMTAQVSIHRSLCRL